MLATEISELYGLGSSGEKALREAKKAIEPHLSDVLERFYAFVTAEPGIKEFFPNSELVEHAKNAQKKHWLLLLDGDFSEEYRRSARTIGGVHFKIQLPFSFYLAGYARVAADVQTLLIRGGGGLSFGGAKSKAALVDAVLRAFYIDAQLVIEAYFEAQQAEQNLALDYLTRGIESFAQRDLGFAIPSPSESDFPARFEPLRDSYNSAREGIGGVISGVTRSVLNLSNTISEVSQSVTDLAMRTERQAATLEETAAAMHSVAESVDGTAKNAGQADGVGKIAARGAEESTSVVAETVDKMNEIEQSSKQISKIIGVIEDIAFQTNLLALNAGVEAARAGDAGRGFAVVASEVRALAQRASEAAKEIKGLISDSSEHVETGVALVAKAGSSLDKILEDFRSISGFVTEIASASREQSGNMNEINAAVGQLDNVTQENAAMVQEASAAAQTMKTEMEGLLRTMQTFQLESHGRNSGHLVPTGTTAATASRNGKLSVENANPAAA